MIMKPRAMALQARELWAASPAETKADRALVYQTIKREAEMGGPLSPRQDKMLARLVGGLPRRSPPRRAMMQTAVLSVLLTVYGLLLASNIFVVQGFDFPLWLVAVASLAILMVAALIIMLGRSVRKPANGQSYVAVMVWIFILLSQSLRAGLSYLTQGPLISLVWVVSVGALCTMLVLTFKIRNQVCARAGIFGLPRKSADGQWDFDSAGA